MVPGGAVITTMILKFSHKSRPSAFRVSEEKSVNAVYVADKENRLKLESKEEGEG